MTLLEVAARSFAQALKHNPDEVWTDPDNPAIQMSAWKFFEEEAADFLSDLAAHSPAISKAIMSGGQD